MPADFGDTTQTRPEERRVAELTIQELNNYCNNNTNYGRVISEQSYYSND